MRILEDNCSSLSQRIFEQLRHAILKGKWQAGQQLPGERELAKRYGANRNTVREAVRRLEEARLVAVRHGLGATVEDYRRTGTPELLLPYLQTQPDMGEMLRIVEDLLEPRVLLMQQVASLAVKRAEDQDVALLREAGAQLGSMYHRGEYDLLIRGYWIWLDHFVDAGHSISVRWIANSLFGALRAVLEAYPNWWVVDQTFPDYLRDTLQAIEQQDEQAARLASRRYFEGVDQKMLFLLRAYAGQPSVDSPVL